MGTRPASSSISGRIALGPSAQLMPTLSKGTCEMEFQKASTVCPVTPRLLPAWMKVTEARMGTCRGRAGEGESGEGRGEREDGGTASGARSLPSAPCGSEAGRKG